MVSIPRLWSGSRKICENERTDYFIPKPAVVKNNEQKPSSSYAHVTCSLRSCPTTTVDWRQTEKRPEVHCITARRACMHACQRRHGGQELQWCRRHGMPPGTFLLRFLISNGEGGIIHLEYLLCTGSNPPILIRNYTRHNKPPGITPLPRPTHPDRAGAAHRCHFTRLII